MCHSRSWAPRFTLIVLFCLPTVVFSQDLTLPADYGIDLKLAEVGRSHIMAGNAEITGTAANETGDEVFHRLVSAGLDQPFPWKLTLVNNGVVNASSTAAGKVYELTPFDSASSFSSVRFAGLFGFNVTQNPRPTLQEKSAIQSMQNSSGRHAHSDGPTCIRTLCGSWSFVLY